MTGLVALVLAVLLGGFMALCMVGLGPEGRKKAPGKYDERQRLSQGQGAIWGLCAVLLFGISVLAANAAAGREVMTASVALGMAMFLGAAVFGNYCVVRDAYIPLGGNGLPECVSMGLLALMSLFHGFDMLEEQGPLPEGMLGPCWAWFLMTLGCASVIVSILAKRFAGRRRK